MNSFHWLLEPPPPEIIHYGPTPPIARGYRRSQGARGVIAKAKHLEAEGMQEILYNQDSNPDEQSFPDLIYFNPYTSRWEVVEVKNLDHKDDLDKDYITNAVTCKTQIPGYPMSLTFIRPRHLHPSARKELTKLAIPVENGILPQYWADASLSWYAYLQINSYSVAGYSDYFCLVEQGYSSNEDIRFKGGTDTAVIGSVDSSSIVGTIDSHSRSSHDEGGLFRPPTEAYDPLLPASQKGVWNSNLTGDLVHDRMATVAAESYRPGVELPFHNGPG
jgi:hypothetical protein